ncbi:hypothetical protein ES332_D09G032200v1 [Gossypium tomentosum]|uniref:Uncharacterized protein n=1 Tax=Gossypium tomentosum TaxID=34277 RepID=A0A5D2JDM0_GOSTO|nr:hypothetical protein ES332_D09G032200v1 [Gossypium tomentosum]
MTLSMCFSTTTAADPIPTLDPHPPYSSDSQSLMLLTPNGCFASIANSSKYALFKKFWVTLTFSKRVSIERVVGSYKWRSYRLATLYVENGSLANINKPNKFGPFSESLVVVYIAQVWFIYMNRVLSIGISRVQIF